jgi:NTE family protein
MTTAENHPHRDALLHELLRKLFPDIPPATIEYIRGRVRWIELAAGATLIEQGGSGDAGYLSISGRLRVYVAADGAPPRAVRELGRGEVIGEMALFTGEPRSATVVAVRDSVLVEFSKADFEALLAQHPQLSIGFTRQMIRRLQTEHLRRPSAAPVTIGLLPVSPRVDIDAFARALAEQLARHGRVTRMDAAALDAAVGAGASTDAAAGERVAVALDALEAQHDFVLLVADAAPGVWSERVVRNSDEILLVADALDAPAVHPLESQLLDRRPARSEAAEILVLLHDAARVMPRDTRTWLARRPVAGHVHVRPALSRDMARLARLVSRKAVGLVLGGGGARGFAHLGVWRALAERGIEIDVVGGTSVGAVMAAVIAADRPIDIAFDVTRRAFARNPTGDFNLLPLVSLIRGGRVRRAVRTAIDTLAGGPIAIEDLWKGYFCIASNYTQAAEQRLTHGDLGHAVLASGAIPGALPPVVHEGDLLCDGGTFNNFPVDAMRDWRGVGRVIGVDLSVRSGRKHEFDEVPGSLALLLDRLKPRAQQRYRLPTLIAYLLNITILYSASRQDEGERLTDLYLKPPLHRVGLLQWSRFDDVVRQGHEHAVEVLDALPPARRAALGARTGDDDGHAG